MVTWVNKKKVDLVLCVISNKKMKRLYRVEFGEICTDRMCSRFDVSKCVRTPTGGKTPHKTLAVRVTRNSVPKYGGVKQEKGVSVDVTTEGGDKNTRTGEGKRKSCVCVSAHGKGKEVTTEHKRTIEIIMSSSRLLQRRMMSLSPVRRWRSATGGMSWSMRARGR